MAAQFRFVRFDAFVSIFRWLSGFKLKFFRIGFDYHCYYGRLFALNDQMGTYASCIVWIPNSECDVSTRLSPLSPCAVWIFIVPGSWWAARAPERAEVWIHLCIIYAFCSIKSTLFLFPHEIISGFPVAVHCGRINVVTFDAISRIGQQKLKVEFRMRSDASSHDRSGVRVRAFYVSLTLYQVKQKRANRQLHGVHVNSVYRQIQIFVELFRLKWNRLWVWVVRGAFSQW